MSKPYPVCRHPGACFAKVKNDANGHTKCSVLYDTHFPGREGGMCPFQKPIKEMTDGEVYPFNPEYGGANAEEESA